MIFRYVENKRKRPTAENPPDFLPYASHYLAMLLGRQLLAQQGITVDDISHRNFQELFSTFKNSREDYYQESMDQVQNALNTFYGQREISLQQLAATFRRGDLMEMLE